MENSLDQIYEDYKKGIKPSERKSKVGPQGVPNPIMADEFDQDPSKVNTCPKCGGMNISVDMSTNKSICRDCQEKIDKPNKIDFQRKMEQAQEEELEKMKEAMKRGSTFLK